MEQLAHDLPDDKRAMGDVETAIVIIVTKGMKHRLEWLGPLISPDVYDHCPPIKDGSV